ncbi:MAG: hypothetical protein V4619_10510 [Bacteroidota bacterium]
MRTTKLTLPLMLAFVVSVFTACQKNNVTPADTEDTSTPVGVIAVTTTTSLAGSTSGTTKDSVYLVNCFGKGAKKDSIAFSSLPAAIGTYLAAHYDGYTIAKSLKITDASGVVVNYIVVINYNGSPVGVKFAADGTFVAVLEQRAGADLKKKGPGFHPGGPFGNRNGQHPDTIALSAIPTAVKTFFTTTYPTDTLLHAAVTPDKSYILISKNQSLFATGITEAGKLIKRVQIDPRPAKHTAVAQASLPAAISTYLTATYPGYVFGKAFSATNKAGVLEYSVFITSNNTKFVVRFDAAGVFIKAIALR